MFDRKVAVFLHSDAVIPDCGCGIREWMVQLPNGWMWVDHAGPGSFDTYESAAEYARSLTPNSSDVTRSFMPDEWVLSVTTSHDSLPVSEANE